MKIGSPRELTGWWLQQLDVAGCERVREREGSEGEGEDWRGWEAANSLVQWFCGAAVLLRSGTMLLSF